MFTTLAITTGLAFTAGTVVGRALAAHRAARWQARCADLDYRATHDPLTGLLNRAGWNAQTSHAHLGWIAMADVDGLREANNQWGHHAGDLLLAVVAEGLADAAAALPGTVVARLGGDEFALWFPGRYLPRQISTRLTRATSRAVPLDDGTVLHPTISVGIAPHTSTIGQDLQRADRAMYRAKRHHQGYALYAADLDGALTPPAQRPRLRPRDRDREFPSSWTAGMPDR